MIKNTFRSAYALAGVLSLIAISPSKAVLVTPTTAETPGAALGAGVPNFGGTVEPLGNQTLAFVDTGTSPGFTGTLRSTVVRNSGGTLDFYYQLANTTQNPNVVDPEIFRLTLDTFSSDFGSAGSYNVFNVDANGLNGITGAGASAAPNNAAFSADREVGTLGTGLGFDWGDAHFIDDVTAPSNLLAGQTGNFLVVRTTATKFATSFATVSGAGTAKVGTFVPIPEPATVLMGLALSSFIGYTELGRNRRRKAQASKA